MADTARAKILLVGSRGQVGWELARTLAPLGDLEAVDRAALDLADLDAVRDAVRASAADVVVNAAAHTQVDRAESEPELAHRLNAEAPAVMAAEASRHGALLVHFSTDYVFDGTGTRPYREDDATGPRTAYGASKLAGDRAVLESGADAYIFRVGWVYGRRGRNFLRTIERLAQERDELLVVADQWGAPTWSRMIAEVATQAVTQWMTARRAGVAPAPPGVYHLASADHTTWHGFASAIVSALPRPDHRPAPRVVPITSAEYPTPAPRPGWSVLDSGRLRASLGIALPSWSEQLRLCLDGE